MHKSNIFRFENWWMDRAVFRDLIESAWKQSIHYVDAAKWINEKMKIMRKCFKKWAKSLWAGQGPRWGCKKPVQSLKKCISLHVAPSIVSSFERNFN